MSSKESIGNWNRKGLEIEHVSLHSHEFYVINLVLCIVDKSEHYFGNEQIFLFLFVIHNCSVSVLEKLDNITWQLVQHFESERESRLLTNLDFS